MLRCHCFRDNSSLFWNMWVVKQVQGDLTVSALQKSTYYKNSINANVIFTRRVQQTKCIIVSRSKNVGRVAIVYLEFLWRNYHCCLFHHVILLQKYLYIEML